MHTPTSFLLVMHAVSHQEDSPCFIKHDQCGTRYGRKVTKYVTCYAKKKRTRSHTVLPMRKASVHCSLVRKCVFVAGTCKPTITLL